ncbi:2703_t:CDS:2 [Dentiscutata heterogama]|uniref:2703_t:CDS:1 n=1 Tax=Dentiscutata heterogama TaxID=1316150 RepID=A0ACA9NDR2_9GLOM|nr:2703_t:CDS:2 [Dentiscutata heterogama]
MEYSTNNDDISTDGISSDPVLISETDSVQTETTQSSYSGGRPQEDIWKEYDIINNGKGKHKGARCRYCTTSWTRGRAQDMKAHLGMKCKGKVPREIRLRVLRDLQSDFLEPGIYTNHVLKKALEIWKQQFGGGRISADLLKTQMNLYKNQKYPFKDKFIASADTITNWWMSRDLKRNEDHIKNLAEKVHSISPHNAACERVFSILGWYFGKRRTRLSIGRLEIMAQMHSYLIENTKSELNYVNPNFPQEDFLSIFNKIASSMKDGTDLFGEEESISFSEELTEELMEELLEEDMESLDEPVDLDQENSNLEIGSFINLQSKLEIDESLGVNEEIVHGDKDFDVNDLLY